MDLGITGRTAIVCGSSSGLGYACAAALAKAGARVIINGRTQSAVQEAATEINRFSPTPVTYVVADVTTQGGRDALLDACPAPDILVNNGAGPPPGQFADLRQVDWEEALRTTMLGPILLIQAALGGMIERRWGRVINITSSAVKSPLPLLHLSNGARSGLTGFIAGLAREVAAHGITINNILPGRFTTPRLQAYIADLATANSVSVEQQGRALLAGNPMGRFGDAPELGALCAFLASERAAYLTGQNILIDGGEFPGSI